MRETPQNRIYLYKNCVFSPGWCDSVNWVPACEPKSCWFDSQSGHMPRLQAWSLVGGTWEATTHWCFSPSLSPSLLLSLKINRIFKKLCIYSYLFKFHFKSTLHLMQHTYQDCFSTAQNSFWTHWFWCLLVLLPFFVSPPPHWKKFPFEAFFHQGKQKNITWGEIRCIGRVGHEVMPFLVKKSWILSAVWAGTLVNHPSWNG